MHTTTPPPKKPRYFPCFVFSLSLSAVAWPVFSHCELIIIFFVQNYFWYFIFGASNIALCCLKRNNGGTARTNEQKIRMKQRQRSLFCFINYLYNYLLIMNTRFQTYKIHLFKFVKMKIHRKIIKTKHTNRQRLGWNMLK